MKTIQRILSLLLTLTFVLTALISCAGNSVQPTEEPGGTTEEESTVTETGESAGIAVTGITLDQNDLTIAVGDKVELKATLEPENATDTRVIWATSDKSVAAVSGGKVTGVSAGEATITATARDGNFKATCKVVVEDSSLPVSSLSFDQTELSMIPGQTEQLKVKIEPAKAAGAKIGYYTSNRSVAIVNDQGVVTAKSEGTATITAYSENEHYAVCTVTVVGGVIPVTNIVMRKTSLQMKIGQSEELKVKDIVEYMQKYPKSKVVITGYADAGTGNDRINDRLGAQRADAVVKALKDTYGISADRITYDSKGARVQPFQENNKNRVTICIAE